MQGEFVDIGERYAIFFSPRSDAAGWLEALRKKNLYGRRVGHDCAHPEGHEICGLTGEALKAEDGVYIVIANGVFPNRTVSAKLVDQIGKEEAARRLLAAYNEALKHKHWLV